MLFNTPEFIFLFLPLALVLHFALARWSPDAAVLATVFSSLVFYAWWNPPFVLLPVLSIAANFWLARRMEASEPRASGRWLIAGIAGNVLVLGYFKYAEFLMAALHGHTPPVPNVPLALSFTTFVQIAFLVYVYQRRPVLDWPRYALFVAFFPHLIAGPIVRWGSLGRQLADRARYRVDWSNVALGLTIFVLGLAKKVLIADKLALHSAPVFEAAERAEPLTLAAAWGGPTAFALQIFFDFSGYSEMAIGLGLLFNFRLPVNFAAPLRATDLFDLWRRWHITLSRFLRDFLYVPIGGSNPGPLRRSVALIITMVLGGLWHGANWTYVVWGALHGVGLVINAGWLWLRGPGRRGPVGNAVGWLLTFTFFVVTIVFFRAASVTSAWHIITAMAGFGNAPGIDTPVSDFTMNYDRWLISKNYVSESSTMTWFGRHWSVVGTLRTLGALALILLIPDTMEIVGYREGDAQSNWRRSLGAFAWRPSLPALATIVALFAMVFVGMGRVNEFLYYQF